MQALPQMYLHDSSPSSFERGIVVQPTGVVHRGCASLPVVDVHPYFTECHDAHQIVVGSSSYQLLTCTPADSLLSKLAVIRSYLYWQILCYNETVRIPAFLDV